MPTFVVPWGVCSREGHGPIGRSGPRKESGSGGWETFETYKSVPASNGNPREGSGSGGWETFETYKSVPASNGNVTDIDRVLYLSDCLIFWDFKLESSVPFWFPDFLRLETGEFHFLSHQLFLFSFPEKCFLRRLTYRQKITHKTDRKKKHQ